MRLRPKGKLKTSRYYSCSCIVDITRRFTSLHAYGIGLNVFRELPEFSRINAIEYSRYMLAFELDDEIDSCCVFLDAMHCNQKTAIKVYLRCSYLLHLYQGWRHLNTDTEKVIPPGAMVVAALLKAQKVKVPTFLRPDCLIAVNRARYRYMVSYLKKRFQFVDWDDDKKYLRIENKNDDRVGDKGNEPQSADAVEIVNGGKDGIECFWGENDNSNGKS